MPETREPQDKEPQLVPHTGRPSATRMLLGPFADAGLDLTRTLRGYDTARLRADLLAGLTVALVAIPQSMAFAQIAGVPPIYGLYTAIIGAAVGALLTSSSHLAIGPTNTMSLLVFAVIGTMAGAAEGEKVRVMVSLTLMAGAMQLAFALARMGQMVRYVSHSVIVGFAAGAGVLIAVGQVPAFLGIDTGQVVSHYHGVPEKIDQLLRAGDAPGLRPIVAGLLSLVTILVCRRISKLLPSYLLAVIVGGGLVWAMGWTEAQLRLVGDLPRGLPPLVLPEVSWAGLEPLMGPALAIALLGMIEAYGIGKTLAGRTGQRINANQEFVCQGVTNLVGACFRCLPSTGSFSRSALNYEAGAKTKFAGLFVGGFVAVTFLILAPAARYIPMASIAAILFVVAFGLIDWRHFRKLCRSNRADAAVTLGTFAATVLIPLDYAVFVGVFLNIALYLRRARQVYITEMLENPEAPTGFIERPLHRNTADREVVFLQAEGNLFFASADELSDRLAALAAGPTKVVILRLKRTHLVDATVMDVIERFAEQMRAKGGWLILTGMRDRMVERMRAYGVIEAVGEDNVFVSDADRPFGAARSAVARAKALLREADSEG